MLLKVLIAVLLASPTAQGGMLASLFQSENSCYTTCHTKYQESSINEEACKKGCDYKLFSVNNNNGLNCQQSCKSYSPLSPVQASCQFGCSSSPNVETEQAGKPEPTRTEEQQQPEGDKPHSIILVRLRQRPFVPSLERLFNTDPRTMFNEMISQFSQKVSEFESAIRKNSAGEIMPKTPEILNEQSKSENSIAQEFQPLFRLVQSIPIMPAQQRGPIAASDEGHEKQQQQHLRLRPQKFIDEIKDIVNHPREQQQRLREKVQPLNARVQQFFEDVRTEWNDLVRKQPRIPMWIFVGILLISSAMLWYMVLALCRHTPSSRNAMSIRAQELVFHPYDNVYSSNEKEKIQPDDELYQVESLPIKVKLSNI